MMVSDGHSHHRNRHQSPPSSPTPTHRHVLRTNPSPSDCTLPRTRRWPTLASPSSLSSSSPRSSSLSSSIPFASPLLGSSKTEQQQQQQQQQQHQQQQQQQQQQSRRRLGPWRRKYRLLFMGIMAILSAFGLLTSLLLAFTVVPDEDSTSGDYGGDGRGVEESLSLAAGGAVEGAGDAVGSGGVQGGGSGVSGGGIWGWITGGSEGRRRKKKRRLWHPKFPGMGRRGAGTGASAVAGGIGGSGGKMDSGGLLRGRGDDSRAASKATKTIRHRIAIVIPYIPPPTPTFTADDDDGGGGGGATTPSLPPYFSAFARTAGGSASIVDFLIFHDGSIPSHLLPPLAREGGRRGGKEGNAGTSDPFVASHSLPPNVKLIDVGGIEGMAALFLRVADERARAGALEMEPDKLVKVLGMRIRGYPYVLVEFKAAYGHVFEEYLRDYTHWGYSDLDIAFGDLPRWITPDELTDYDIVTYSYGDQDRAYLRGQFTFHRNTEKTRNIWRGCSFLSEIDKRFARAAAGKDKLKFESAEGCYSQVVLRRDDLRVKFAVKALNDLGDEADTVYTHGLYIGVGSNGDRSVVWKAGPSEGDGALLRDLPMNWFEDSASPYGNSSWPPLQREVGERVRIHSFRDIYGNISPEGKEANCMFWAPKKYQPDICLVGVDSKDTVFLIDGVLYKQPYEEVNMPGNVVSRPFYHFMEWKRFYRPTQLAPMSRAPTKGDISGWILSAEGAIPLPSVPSGSKKGQAPRSGGGWSWPLLGSRQRASDDDDRNRFPPTAFCLRSSRRKVPPRPAAAQCDYFTSWRDAGGVQIVHEGDDRTKYSYEGSEEDSGVTLALTLELSVSTTRPSPTDLEANDGLLALAESNIRSWSRGGQPAVLVIYAGGAGGRSDEVNALIRKRFTGEKKAYLAQSLVAVVAPPNVSRKEDKEDRDVAPVSRKALRNLATVAARTRWVVSGLDSERGMVLSTEAVGFAHQVAMAYAGANGGRTGSVFVMPQLAAKQGFDYDRSKGEVDDNRTKLAEPISLTELLHQGKNLDESTITPFLSSFDCVPCRNHDQPTEEELGNHVLNFWKEMTWRELSESAKAEYAVEDPGAILDEPGKSILNFERALLSLLENINYESLQRWDVSILTMLDQLGPWRGVRTIEIAPEVEEFGGGSGRCFDALRLAQLSAMGYHIAALPGGFALSSPTTRKLACGGDLPGEDETQELPYCNDGCSMFPNNKLLEDMAYDERMRPAKAAVLWSEIMGVSKKGDV